MKENKDISILRDDIELISISKDNRTIKADEIFKLFDYNSGDTYEIQTENEKSLDEPVLNFFYELIKEISDQIISYKDEEDEYANTELVDDIKDYKMDN